MTSKLEIYNTALAHIGERKISGLTEAREPRRVLDDFYASVVAYALERGFWNWSMRTVELASSDSYSPTFGPIFAFEKPTDWVRTYVVSANATLKPPLLEYIDEGGIWYADSDPLYIKYVSNDSTYGNDISQWPESFADYVGYRLAVRTCNRITGKAAGDELMKAERRALSAARSRDAMDEPPAFPARGTWATSRVTDRNQRRRADNQS